MADGSELEPAPHVMTDGQRRSVLRRCLASGLRTGGHDHLAAAEVTTTQPARDGTSSAAGVVIFLGVWLGAADLVDGPWWSWLLIGAAVLFGLAAISQRSGALSAFVILIAWALTLWLQIRTDGLWLLSHVFPAGGLLMFALVTRQVDVRSVRDLAVAGAAIPRAVPLIAPLVLVVLVLPSLSTEVWQVADALDPTRLVLLTTITAGLLFVLVLLQLRSELPQVIAGRAAALTTSPTRVQETRRALRARLSDETFELASIEADEFIAEAWPPNGTQYAAFIATASGRQLTRPLMARLGGSVLVIGVLVSFLLYALVSVLVDPAVASGWLQEEVPQRTLEVWGTAIEFPCGPYISITALLTCLALATFLGFALIEERYSVALGDALLRLPVDRLLALALPFLHLLEERISDGDPLPDEFDVGAS